MLVLLVVGGAEDGKAEDMEEVAVEMDVVLAEFVVTIVGKKGCMVAFGVCLELEVVVDFYEIGMEIDSVIPFLFFECHRGEVGKDVAMGVEGAVMAWFGCPACDGIDAGDV